jgi:hypothetical protein
MNRRTIGVLIVCLLLLGCGISFYLSGKAKKAETAQVQTETPAAGTSDSSEAVRETVPQDTETEEMPILPLEDDEIVDNPGDSPESTAEATSSTPAQTPGSAAAQKPAGEPSTTRKPSAKPAGTTESTDTEKPSKPSADPAKTTEPTDTEKPSKPSADPAKTTEPADTEKPAPAESPVPAPEQGGHSNQNEENETSMMTDF